MASRAKGRHKPDSSSSHNTGTGTFRLDSKILDGLKEEAEQKRTSLNTLVSQVLQAHSEYHTFAAKAGMVSMPKTLLIRLMNKLDEQEVIQLSEYIAKDDLKDAILMMKGRYSPETVMDFIESWSRAGGYPIRHHAKEDEDGKSSKNHAFVIQHDMGERWSLFLVELFRFAFEQAGQKISFQHTQNTISFEIEI